jgi:hypothetical protein
MAFAPFAISTRELIASGSLGKFRLLTFSLDPGLFSGADPLIVRSLSMPDANSDEEITASVANSAANILPSEKLLLLPPVLDAIAELLRYIEQNCEYKKPSDILGECSNLKDKIVALGVQFAETNFDCESDEYEPAIPWTLKDSLAVDVDDKGVPCEALLVPTLDAVADLLRTMDRRREDISSTKDCIRNVQSLQWSMERLGVTFSPYDSEEGEDEDDDEDRPATWKIGASNLEL